MPPLLKGTIADGGSIVEDRWSHCATLQDALAVAPGAPVVVPFAVWTDSANELASVSRPLGIEIETSTEPELIAPFFSQLSLIVIRFDDFTDGRGYSLARLLRQRFGYRGALRASGAVLRDQVFYLLRCGFDELAPRADQSLDAMLGAFRDFTDRYQASVEEVRPLFLRRAPGSVTCAG